jgi:hypothetical protein
MGIIMRSFRRRFLKFPNIDKMFVLLFTFICYIHGFPIDKISPMLKSWNHESQNFRGHQVWQINVNQKSQLDFLSLLESVILNLLIVQTRLIDIWTSDSKLGSMDFRIAPADHVLLQKFINLGKCPKITFSRKY